MSNKLKDDTRCIFCNSKSYGYGCPYSPHKRHVHISNGVFCIYCGSTSNGYGCPLNPFNKFHVKGSEYNFMIKESLNNSIVKSLLVESLTYPITESEAYKRGLIDDKGYKIKEPETIEEKASLTPIDQILFRMRRVIGEEKLKLFKSSVLLEIARNDDKFDIEKYKKEIEIKNKINDIMQELKNIFIESIELGFSKEFVENLIIDGILKEF